MTCWSALVWGAPLRVSPSKDGAVMRLFLEPLVKHLKPMRFNQRWLAAK